MAGVATTTEHTLIDRSVLGAAPLLCLFLLAGCDRATGPAPQSTVATLIYGRESEADLLDPIHTDVGETVKVVHNIYETLVTYAEDSLEIVPALATAWSHTDDGLQWTFQLRPDVEFHDGSRFDAEAVVYSFGRLLESDHPGVFSDVVPFRPTYALIERIEVVGPLEVVFHLRTPSAVFLENLCMYPASIVSPRGVAQHGAEFGVHPVGTGPYRLGRWQRDVELELVAFDAYWDGRPQLDRVVFVPINEAEARRRRLLRGELHMVDNLPPDIVDDLARDPQLVVQEQAGINVGYLSMQNDKWPLNDPRVRQAIGHAIDKQTLVRDVYAGHAVPAVTMVPPTMWGHHTKLTDRSYDPEASRRLLREAGISTPLRLRLFAMQTARPYMQRPRETAVFIKDALGKIGIDVEIVTQENNTHFQQLSRGEHELALAGWSSDNNDPDNFLYQLLDVDNINNSGNNNARYRNERFHELIIAAKRELDRDRRREYYLEAQEIAFGDAPTVPLVHVPLRIVHSKRVKGYKLHPGWIVRFRWTALATADQG